MILILFYKCNAWTRMRRSRRFGRVYKKKFEQESVLRLDSFGGCLFKGIFNGGSGESRNGKVGLV